MINNVLNTEKINEQKIFNSKYIQFLWDNFKKGFYHDQYLLWDIIFLQMRCGEKTDKPSCANAAA